MYCRKYMYTLEIMNRHHAKYCKYIFFSVEAYIRVNMNYTNSFDKLHIQLP